jgi:hypothetical protein
MTAFAFQHLVYFLDSPPKQNLLASAASAAANIFLAALKHRLAG